MGNSPSQAPAEHIINEETNWSVSAGSGSGPGLGIIMVGVAAAGAALLALGTWRLVSQLFSGDAADTDKDEVEKGGIGKSDGVDGDGLHRREAFERASSRNRGEVVDSGGFHRLEDLRRPSSNRGEVLLAPPSPSTYKRETRLVAIKFLSYNVWFREDVNVKERMKAIGNLVKKHSPDLICFQEVTPMIYEMFESSKWGEAYSYSLSAEKASRRRSFCMQMSKLPANFDRQRLTVPSMVRELCMAEVDVGMGRKLVFAACHLKSPNPDSQNPDRMYSTERVGQAKKALKLLKKHSNVVLGGDMNWNEEVDGAFPLPHGWVDAWEELRPGEDGWTFDTKANKMISRKPPLQKRLDRFLCCLKDFRIGRIEMIGMEAIPELSSKRKKILPSDHFGLLLTIYKLQV